MKTLLVAGGSGGHLIPALSLAESLRSAGDTCWMVSTRKPVDQILAAISPEQWKTVNLERLTPLWRWFIPGFSMRQARAVGEIWAVLRQDRPDVVVGFGGYLSAVAVLAAKRAGIPTVLHEQNLLPGRSNRLLARWSDAVAVSFQQTRRHLPRKMRVEVTGNPIRTTPDAFSFEKGRAAFQFDDTRPVLLVTGGSQGSRSINRLALAMWERFPLKDRRQFQVIHLAGWKEADSVEALYRRLGVEARVFPFLHEMHHAFSAATLAVSRAGATGIAEMVAFHVPAILIPYPFAQAHQSANAEWMRSIGGALVLEEKETTSDRLWNEIHGLLGDPDRLEGMRKALEAQCNGSAAQRLAQLVREVAAA